MCFAPVGRNPVRNAKKKLITEIAHAIDGQTYSVLVPLFHEAPIVDQLVASLNALDWPPGSLNIVLICEESDLETISALKKLNLPQHFCILIVPHALPLTKPKALNYALSTVNTKFVVVYDAEDRPHPKQLKEAFKKFRDGDPDLACVQAPLIITNTSQSYLSRLFGFEYSVLFRGVLPFLAHYNLFLPLGGTSNHFDLEKLRSVGAWDPYNVTEDADLGLRLFRKGLKTDIIQLPTYEDAPTELNVWLKQRTRWLKGWGQTWLVLMRHPVKAYREIGVASFILAQILFVGLLASAAIHMLVFFGYLFWAGYAIISEINTVSLPTFMELDAINFLLGYLSFFTLGVITTKIDNPRIDIFKVALTLPLYWALLSISAWRAIFQIIFKPHYWEKTPHKPSKRNISTL